MSAAAAQRPRTKLKLSLIAEISARRLRRTTKVTGLDRKTIRAILNGRKVKASTLVKVVMGLQRTLRKHLGNPGKLG